MRVLQLCNKAPFPPNDGSSIAIYNMGEGFISNGVELHVLTINTKKHFKADENIPKEYREKAHYRSVFENTDVSPLGALKNIFSSQSYFVSRFYFKDFRDELIAKLKSTEFDIIQLEGLFVATYIPVIKKYSKAKIVLRAHNIEYLIWERHLKNETSFLKKMYLGIQTKRLKNFELKILSDLDAIVTITDFDKTVFEKLAYKKPVYTCITGVDVESYRKKVSDVKKPKTIFHFASMDWMPNIEAVDWFLNNCWKNILRQVPDAKFVMAGRNMPPRLAKLNQPNVLVVESVKDSKAFYNEHEIMLVPLLSGSGLRIKIIEGLAYGKAIVSTSVGAEGINYTNGKNILIADTPADFTRAVVELLKDNTKRQTLEQGALNLAEREFDNGKVVAGLVNFYKTVLNA
jgi:glycosyltransferase involved in cell wall biosynthesis